MMMSAKKQQSVSANFSADCLKKYSLSLISDLRPLLKCDMLKAQSYLNKGANNEWYFQSV